ncbi:MAG: hypothetical protein IT445_04855 [Phycisphaeraceae bacterium]|nr:hypothetical protein [Phycisphaeraceae bacterium]
MRSVTLSLCLLAAAGGAVPGWAATSQRVEQPHSRASLISEQAAVAPGQTLTVGLLLEPDEHWHTYWQNPGDSGLATSIRWTLPEGYEAGDIQWPAPQLFRLPGPILNFGYEGPVLLLTQIKVPAEAPGDSVTIQAAARWLTCSPDACLPGKANLTLTLPLTAQNPPSNAAAAAQFDAARADMPRAVEGDEIKVDFNAEARFILLSFTLDQPIEPEQIFFFAADGQHIQAQPGLIERVKDNTYAIALKLVNDQSPPPPRLRGVLRCGDNALWIDRPIPESRSHE